MTLKTKAYPVYAPKIEITVITEKENLVFRGTTVPLEEIDSYHLDWEVISCITKRDIASDNPTFSINLVYRNDWLHKIASNDLIIIKMCRGNKDEGLKTVFVGLVDDCRLTGSYNKKPTRTITITGRGVSKAFVQFEIGIVQETDVHVYAVGWLVNNEVNIMGADAGQAIEAVLNNFTQDKVYYDFGKGRTLKSYVAYNLGGSTKEKLIDVMSLMEHQGTLWSLFRELQGAPFNELFWEINDNEIPELICRQTPFNATEWNTLPVVNLDEIDVIEEELGKSDLETYTLYSVSCRTFMSPADQKGTLGNFPLWYEPYQKKYGISRLDVTSPYLIYANESDKGEASSRSLKYTRWLFDWNIKNNSMFNGSLIVGGSNKYKLGQRLSYLDMEYYIESVSHSFHAYTSYTCQLEVTRGIQPSERFTAPVGQGVTFDPEQAFKYGIYSYSQADLERASGVTSGSTIPPEVDKGSNTATTPGNKKVPIFIQGKYGKVWTKAGRTIAQSGCGLCCVSMISSYYSGKDYNPNVIGDWALKNPSPGVNYAAFEDIANAYSKPGGYNWTGYGSIKFDDMLKTVKNGGLGVVQIAYGVRYGLSNNSPSHFVVVVDMDGGNLIVNDPAVGIKKHPVEAVRNCTIKVFGFTKRAR